jgi:hypothetical protein
MPSPQSPWRGAHTVIRYKVERHEIGIDRLAAVDFIRFPHKTETVPPILGGLETGRCRCKG